MTPDSRAAVTPGAWMPTQPLATFRAVLVAVLAVPIAAVAIAQWQWTDLQRFYVKTYIKTSVGSGRLKTYPLVLVTAKGREFLATDADVAWVEDAAGEPTFVLTPAARAAGFDGLTLASVTVPNGDTHARLTRQVYKGRRVGELAQLPLLVGGLTLLALLCWSVPADWRRARERRAGVRLRGPAEVPIGEFNRRMEAYK